MPTIRAANAALSQARRWAASGLFRLASCILRGAISLYRRHLISRVPLLAALWVTGVLERSAGVLFFGLKRPRD
jgi:hypothetical protein